MIFGVNDTDPGSDSNGSGKSTLIEGITLAFTGLTCRDVNKEDFIQDGEDECFVQFDLENKVGDVNQLSIRRWFHRKKSSKAEIWENGAKNEEMTSVNEVNKRIFELIGLTREDLLHFFIIGQDTNFSFMTVNDTEKKNIIARFSNSDNINLIMENLKKDKSEIEKDELRKLDKTISSIESKIEIFESELEELLNDKSDSNAEKIKKIDSDIKSLKKENSSLDDEIFNLEAEKYELSFKLEGFDFDGSNLQEAEESLEDWENKYKLSKSKARKIQSTIDHLESLKEGLLTCPKCNNQFNPSAEIDATEMDELIQYSNEELILANSKVKRLKKKVTDKELGIERIKERLKEVKEVESNIHRIKLKIDGKRDEISINDNSIERLKQSKLKLAEQTDNKKRIDEVRLKIAESEKDKASNYKILESVIERVSAIDFWIYHFGKKGFSTYLSNKSVKVIEGMTNSYLARFNSDLQVMMDGFTTLKSGELSEKISISILRNGQRLGSFKRYSGGEKGRINLANIVGLQKLINMSAPTGGLNLLVLDEVFDGLDSTGQRDVINILENIGVTTLVVSHRSDPIGSKNELYIKKTDGVSRILN